MRRYFALDSKIVYRFHDTAAEDMMPQAVYHDSAGKRVIWIGYLLGELQSTTSLLPKGHTGIGKGRKKPVGNGLLAKVLQAAPDEYRTFNIITIHHTHHKRGIIQLPFPLLLYFNPLSKTCYTGLLYLQPLV
jgi:hypothetical protein